MSENHNRDEFSRKEISREEITPEESAAARRMPSSHRLKQVEAAFASLAELTRRTAQGQTWNEQGYVEIPDPAAAGGQPIDAGLAYSGRFQRSVHEAEEAWRTTEQGQ